MSGNNISASRTIRLSTAMADMANVAVIVIMEAVTAVVTLASITSNTPTHPLPRLVLHRQRQERRVLLVPEARLIIAHSTRNITELTPMRPTVATRIMSHTTSTTSRQLNNSNNNNNSPPSPKVLPLHHHLQLARPRPHHLLALALPLRRLLAVAAIVL